VALLLSLRSMAAPANVLGVVVDSEGASIRNAHVVVHADFSGRRTIRGNESDTVIDADAEGHFGLQLQPGFYDMCVMADAFSPVCRKLFVNTSGILRPRVQLKADPEVMKRLGDVF